MTRKVSKLLGIGGAGAAAGAFGIDALELTAAGTVGAGIGYGVSALIFGATGGGLLALACFGVYKYVKN